MKIKKEHRVINFQIEVSDAEEFKLRCEGDLLSQAQILRLLVKAYLNNEIGIAGPMLRREENDF